MTEYWKSQAKKYCDVCKCWITDNKASVQFHESGKRHQENVKKKISDLSKKATKDFKAKKQLDDDMKKMEQAALQAYMKDVHANPDHSGLIVREHLESSELQLEEEQSTNQTKKIPVEAQGSKERTKETEYESKVEEYVSGISKDRIWYEAKSDEGHTYYWNTQSSESVWKAPEGYVTLDEQKEEENRQKAALAGAKKRKHALESAAKVRNEEVRAAVEREKMREKYAPSQSRVSPPVDDEESDDEPIGPEPIGPRNHPYGGWTTVETHESSHVDLQLPPSYQPAPQPAVFASYEPRVKIKEKKLDPSKIIGDGATSFKKRKLSHRGNARQRFDDEDD